MSLFLLSVANQYYESEVLSEYIIKGNAALIKCNIPSFVTDFARVEAWIGSDGQNFTFHDNETDYGDLDKNLYTFLKLNNPSNQTFFLIYSLIVNFHILLPLSIFYVLVVNQFYKPGLMDDEYVMKGNAAIMKCSIPSFVSDFVSVVGWVDEDGNEFVSSENYVESKTQMHPTTPTHKLFSLYLVIVMVIVLVLILIRIILKKLIQSGQPILHSGND